MWWFSVALVILLNASNVVAETLSLYTEDAYIESVKNGSSAFSLSLNAEKTAKKREVEIDKNFDPIFSASIQAQNDDKETANQASMGRATISRGAEVSVAQATDFGLEAKATARLGLANIKGASKMFLPLHRFHSSATTVELGQSLWRNHLGSEIQTQKNLAKIGSDVSSTAEEFKRKSQILQAKMTYLRLALARESLAILQKAIDRAQKLRRWAEGRASDNLSDKGDLLSSVSNLAARRVDLDMAMSEEKAAKRAFNFLRGLSTDTVEEKLQKIASSPRAEIKAPSSERLDLKLSRLGLEASKLSYDLNEEKNKPDLKAFAAVQLNGRDKDFAPSTREGLTTSHPTLTLGVRLTMNLGCENNSKYRAFLAEDIRTATLEFEHKKSELEKEWRELKERASEIRERLRLIQSLKESQKEKLAHEQEKHEIGRTTLFQVLSYEGEYSLTELTELRTQAELRQIMITMELFENMPQEAGK